MKLVEILARELEEWRDGASCATQDEKSRTAYFWRSNRVRNTSGKWNHDTGIGLIATGWSLRLTDLASDHATAIVTRADWEAERAKLKAPKANGDGWVRHRGGKRPVDGGVRVDVRYRDGYIEMVKAGDMRWGHGLGGGDIMAYRIHKPAEQPQQASHTFSQANAPEQILTIRDCIYELDSMRAEVESIYQRQISEITQERESLVQKLAGEGLALAEVVVQPVEFDPLDKSTWQIGCSVEIESSENPGWTIRKSVVGVLKFDEEMYHLGWYIDYASIGHWCISDDTRIKFVSRPAT